MWVYDDKCSEFGLDPKKVASIARRISKAAKEASDLHLTVFGGSGNGTLRFDASDRGGAQTAVADLDGSFDGGDGGDNW